MKLEIDEDMDAIYLHITRVRIVDTRKATTGERIDYDTKGNVVGIEILGARARFCELSALTAQSVLAQYLSEVQEHRAPIVV